MKERTRYRKHMQRGVETVKFWLDGMCNEKFCSVYKVEIGERLLQSAKIQCLLSPNLRNGRRAEWF